MEITLGHPKTNQAPPAPEPSILNGLHAYAQRLCRTYPASPSLPALPAPSLSVNHSRAITVQPLEESGPGAIAPDVSNSPAIADLRAALLHTPEIQHPTLRAYHFLLHQEDETTTVRVLFSNTPQMAWNWVEVIWQCTPQGTAASLLTSISFKNQRTSPTHLLNTIQNGPWHLIQHCDMLDLLKDADHHLRPDILQPLVAILNCPHHTHFHKWAALFAFRDLPRVRLDPNIGQYVIGGNADDGQSLIAAIAQTIRRRVYPLHSVYTRTAVNLLAEYPLTLAHPDTFIPLPAAGPDLLGRSHDRVEALPPIQVPETSSPAQKALAHKLNIEPAVWLLDPEVAATLRQILGPDRLLFAITFSGQGDSGEWVCPYDRPADPDDTTTDAGCLNDLFTSPTHQSLLNGQMVPAIVREQYTDYYPLLGTSPSDFPFGVLWDLLAIVHQEHVGWENDDGASGEITVYVGPDFPRAALTRFAYRAPDYRDDGSGECDEDEHV